MGETDLKKTTQYMRKHSISPLLALLLITVVALVGGVSTVPVIAQSASTTTVYLNPPTINGTVVGQEFTVNMTIHDALAVQRFGLGLTFNPDLLNCTSFNQGEFLKSAGSTFWIPGTINNVAGRVDACACSLLGAIGASGDGRLAYLTFKVKTPGVSDLHITNLKVFDLNGSTVWANIIDVYTVVLDTTSHKVVTVSNTTGATATYASGFSGHTFSLLNKEISLNVVGPYAGFANVTIPKALVSVESPDEWKVKVDDISVSRTLTYNSTHYSVYFTYDLGIHQIKITTKRDLSVSLEAPATLNFGESTLLNATVHNFGVNNETDVELQILINGTLANSTVVSLLQVASSYTLSYLWMPDATVTVTYNVTAYVPPMSGENVTNNVATKFVECIVLRELVVSLDTPVFLGPGDSSFLNATVYNFGWKNETDVEFQMRINGIEVNSTIISLLQMGHNYTLSYFWSPPPVEAKYNVTAYASPVTGETVTDNNVATKFVMIGQFFIDPSSGPIGTKTTVYGADFPNQTQVLVTYNDMPMGSVTTDQDGAFIFVFNIPISVAGEQTVKAFDVSNVSNYAITTFTVIDVTPLDIETEVGTIHFRGEIAEFYIQIAFKGTLVDATITKATLHYANGTMNLDLTANVEYISTGLYRIPYPIPANATLGSYILTIEATYTTTIVETKGVSSKSLLLSPKLTAEDALIIDIKDEIATIIIPNLDVIKANITAINAELFGLNGTTATINSTLGSLQTSINTIDLKVTSIVNDIATIQTTLGTIEGKITSVEGNTATIETEIGNVKVDVSAIKGTQETFTIPLYAAVTLALIAAIGAIFIIIFLRRKPKP